MLVGMIGYDGFKGLAYSFPGFFRQKVFMQKN
jgi:hypothetical protein